MQDFSQCKEPHWVSGPLGRWWRNHPPEHCGFRYKSFVLLNTVLFHSLFILKGLCWRPNCLWFYIIKWPWIVGLWHWKVLALYHKHSLKPLKLPRVVVVISRLMQRSTFCTAFPFWYHVQHFFFLKNVLYLQKILLRITPYKISLYYQIALI